MPKRDYRKEREVAVLTACGWSVPRIAEHIGISKATVSVIRRRQREEQDDIGYPLLRQMLVTRLEDAQNIRDWLAVHDRIVAMTPRPEPQATSESDRAITIVDAIKSQVTEADGTGAEPSPETGAEQHPE